MNIQHTTHSGRTQETFSTRLSFGIPTYNRKEMLEEALEYFFETLKLQNFRLYISDNASTDGSAEVIERYSKKYANIEYFIQGENIGADANMTFLWSKCKTEYIWLLGDGIRVLPEQMKRILECLSLNDYDAIVLNWTGHHELEHSRLYTDRNEVLLDFGLWMTNISAHILSKNFLTFSPSLLPLSTECYRRSEFNFWRRMFIYLGKNESCNVLWLPEVHLFSSKLKKESAWHKNAFSVWVVEFVEAVLSLPNYSELVKSKCLRDAGSSYLYSESTLLEQIYNGVLTWKDIYKHKESWEKVIQADYRFYILLCFFPKPLLRYCQGHWRFLRGIKFLLRRLGFRI
jgi:glycosyltransferase involved in cell wall biosynthesis